MCYRSIFTNLSHFRHYRRRYFRISFANNECKYSCVSTKHTSESRSHLYVELYDYIGCIHGSWHGTSFKLSYIYIYHLIQGALVGLDCNGVSSALVVVFGIVASAVIIVHSLAIFIAAICLIALDTHAETNALLIDNMEYIVIVFFRLSSCTIVSCFRCHIKSAKFLSIKLGPTLFLVQTVIIVHIIIGQATTYAIYFTIAIGGMILFCINYQNHLFCYNHNEYWYHFDRQ